MKTKRPYILVVLLLITVGIGLFAYLNFPKWSCENQGGAWGRIGLDLTESCNLPTSDAGKECSGSGECEGACIAELTAEEWDKAEKGEVLYKNGTCSSWRIVVACHAFVENGMAEVLCID